MDSYYPNVEMVLVEDVNDIVDPLDTIDIDIDIPAIKLELDDSINSDEEFQLKENKSYEEKGSDEWIEQSETLTNSDIVTSALTLTKSFRDDSSSPNHVNDIDCKVEHIQCNPDEQKSIRARTKVEADESIKSEAIDSDVKPTEKKTVKVNLFWIRVV